MYKVGDEVLVNGTVENVEDYGAVVYVCGMGKAFFNKKELIPANKTYEQGSADAWKLAKKLFAEYKDSELCEIFGKGWSYPKLMEFTYEEVLAKIEAYEKEKSVCVGDVVKNVHNGAEYIVLDTKDGRSINTSFTAFSRLNICGFENDVWKKTGKHIDIESLLRQIGE